MRSRSPIARCCRRLTAVGHQIGSFFERRRAQDELDRFFTMSLDMLCLAGFDGYFKRVNPAWQKHLGWSEQGAAVAPVPRADPPGRPGGDLCGRKPLSEGHDVVSFENRYFHKNGSTGGCCGPARRCRPKQIDLRHRARHDGAQGRRGTTMAELVRALESSKQRARGRRGHQERVSRQHEPRDPHADQRRHRHDRPGAADPAHRRAARLPDDRQVVGRGAARV